MTTTILNKMGEQLMHAYRVLCEGPESNALAVVSCSAVVLSNAEAPIDRVRAAISQRINAAQINGKTEVLDAMRELLEYINSEKP